MRPEEVRPEEVRPEEVRPDQFTWYLFISMTRSMITEVSIQ